MKYIKVYITSVIIIILFLIIYLIYKYINIQETPETQYAPEVHIIHKINVHTVKIITTKLIESIAINLSKFLKELNLNVIIKYDLSEEECENSTENELYIFINISMIRHDKLPKLFILYQVEQSHSKWFNDKYYKYLHNANNIWEFSIKNRILYNDISLNNIFYQMIPYYYNDNDNKFNNILDDDTTYDIFFFGAQNNRRKNILNYLSTKFNLKIGFDIYGDDKYELIKKSKIILNLHYYDDCALETCRINEILQYNKVIISEKSAESDWYSQSLYEDIVDFVDIILPDLSNIDILEKKIEYYLYNYNYVNKIKQIRDNKIILHNKSKFNLYKNLYNIIKFDNYVFGYDLTHDTIYCLHLIETPDRINEFKKINKMNNKLTKIKLEIFPAFKYNPGWKGCALSYINLIYNAKRCNLKDITICEDDCRFPSDFTEKYNIIKDFLSKIQWDIFVGVIADLPEDVIITNIYQYKNIKFIEINKMHSTVFNIYNNSVYDTIINWKKNTNDSNDSNDQIDQYIKRQNFKIITTYPFYFDCINVDSTLWKKNLFNYYNNMFQKSLNILEFKIKNYRKNIIKIY